MHSNEENKNITYRVQVGAYRIPLDAESKLLQTIDGLAEEKLADGLTRYVTRSYPSIAQADKRKRDVRQNGGVPDAYVVAYINGKRTFMKNIYDLLNK